MSDVPHILIPTSHQNIVIFPDELPILPADYNDLIDALRLELAPLRTWRRCAVEYHRQGFDAEFENVLREVVEPLADSAVETIYRDRDENYLEGITEIYVALAAKELLKLTRTFKVPHTPSFQDGSRKIIEYLKLADEKQHFNEWVLIIKGFFELYREEYEHAASQFRFINERTKGNTEKRKYRFVSLVGLALVAYHKQEYKSVYAKLAEAITCLPSCSSTMRLGLAFCFFKMGQYEYSRLALNKAFQLDPTDANVLVMYSILELAVARKENRANRLEHRSRAFDYSTIASVIDPKNSMAINLLANHYFHTWKPLTSQVSISLHEKDVIPRVKMVMKVPLSNGVCGSFIIDEQHIGIACLNRNYLVAIADTMSVADLILFDYLVTESRSDNNVAGLNPNQFLYNSEFGVSSILSSLELDNLFVTKVAELALHSIDHFKQISSNFTALEFLHQHIIIIKLSSKMAINEQSLNKDVSLRQLFNMRHRELGRVEKLAKEALSNNAPPLVRSESFYILGKVAHIRKNINLALEYYQLTLKDHTDSSLAGFSAAQIMLAREEFGASLDLFEKVLSKNPDDKDTQCYVHLLKAIHKSEDANFDKLKEVAPGFQFEVDLWLIQGQLKQQKPAEHGTALKCYLNAKDCLDKLPVDHLISGDNLAVVKATLFSNIAVLSHSLGKSFVAIDYCKKSLSLLKSSTEKINTIENSVARLRESPIVRNSEFENVFYSWNSQVDGWVEIIDCSSMQQMNPSGDITQVDPTNQDRSVSIRLCNEEDLLLFKSLIPESEYSAGQFVDFQSQFSVADELVLGTVKYSVVTIDSSTQLKCISPLNLSFPTSPSPEMQPRDEPDDQREEVAIFNKEQKFVIKDKRIFIPIRQKQIFDNFNDGTLSECYNLARMLEAVGQTKSSLDIYVELLKNHPSFVECYMRLSAISCDLGKFDDASVWLSRALAVNPEETDAMISLGDLYIRSNHIEDAKRFYDKVVSKNKHDAKSMLSLGNFHYQNASKSKPAAITNETDGAQKAMKSTTDQKTSSNSHKDSSHSKHKNKEGNSQQHVDQLLKDSYKFYFHVLNEDKTNLYAANGLAMICAAKSEFHAAKDIFSRVRDSTSLLNVEDVSINLAHINVLSGNHIDAEHLYQASLKSISRNNKLNTEKAVALLSDISYAQFKSSLNAGRNEDTARTILRAIHLDPGNLNSWFNVGLVREKACNFFLNQRTARTVVDIQDAIENATFAQRIFSFLSAPVTRSIANPRHIQYDKINAAEHTRILKQYLETIHTQLQSAEADEFHKQELRNQQEQEHLLRQRQKQEELLRQQLAAENEKKEKQLLASLKMKRLEELQEKWVASNPNTRYNDSQSDDRKDDITMKSNAGSGHEKKRKQQVPGEKDSQSKGKRRKSTNQEEQKQKKDSQLKAKVGTQNSEIDFGSEHSSDFDFNTNDNNDEDDLSAVFHDDTQEGEDSHNRVEMSIENGKDDDQPQVDVIKSNKKLKKVQKKKDFIELFGGEDDDTDESDMMSDLGDPEPVPASEGDLQPAVVNQDNNEQDDVVMTENES